MFSLLGKLKAEIQAWIDLSQRGRQRAAEMLAIDAPDEPPAVVVSIVPDVQASVPPSGDAPPDEPAAVVRSSRRAK